VQAVGSAEVAEKLAVSNCKHVIVDVAKGLDREAADARRPSLAPSAILGTP
jgi:hypothetical protein